MKIPANRVARPSTTMEKLLAYQPLQIFTGLYGKISIGGHLVVTESALIFEPHGVNLTNEQITIPFRDITNLDKKQKLAAALLVVDTSIGIQETFVCWKRDEVIEEVNKARGL